MTAELSDLPGFDPKLWEDRILSGLYRWMVLGQNAEPLATTEEATRTSCNTIRWADILEVQHSPARIDMVVQQSVRTASELIDHSLVDLSEETPSRSPIASWTDLEDVLIEYRRTARFRCEHFCAVTPAVYKALLGTQRFSRISRSVLDRYAHPTWTVGEVAHTPILVSDSLDMEEQETVLVGAFWAWEVAVRVEDLRCLTSPLGDELLFTYRWKARVAPPHSVWRLSLDLRAFQGTEKYPVCP